MLEKRRYTPSAVKKEIETRNATRSNNRDNLLQLSLNFNIFRGPYITQSNIYDGAYIAKMLSR